QKKPTAHIHSDHFSPFPHLSTPPQFLILINNLEPTELGPYPSSVSVIATFLDNCSKRCKIASCVSFNRWYSSAIFNAANIATLVLATDLDARISSCILPST